MKKYNKLNRFPLGCIKAEGFLKSQMQIGKDGMCGHLHELEPKMIADPFLNVSHVKAWGEGDKLQYGWGAEIAGNYWTGYIQFAFTLNDEEMIKTATNWVDAMLKVQREDGYLGNYTAEGADIYDDYNAWGSACALRGMIAFYEATGRKDVLEAVHRCMLWFCDKWSGDKKTNYAGPFIIETMVFTYYYTKDEKLIKFAEEYTEFLCDHDDYNNSYKAMLSEEFYYNSNHTAGVGINLRLPALVYSVTGNEEYLKASEKMIEKVRKYSVQLSGAPVSQSEYLGPVSSTVESEYCGFTFYNAVYSSLCFITGEAKYGDYMEEVFYNAAQGARKKDEKAIAYFTSPNQIFATDWSSHTWGDMQVYAPCYTTSCCPVNAVAIVPEFIRGMMLYDENDNIYVVAYGPCSLQYKDMSMTEKTYYPFRNSTAFEINCNKKFELNLKVPEWCESFTVTVNGEVNDFNCQNGYVKIDREWKKGDKVDILFHTDVKVIRVNDADASAKFPLAIKYGALLYSYHIPEKWTPIDGSPMTKLPEGWSWFNVEPVYENPSKEISNRNRITWNIALDEELTKDDFIIEELSEDGYVWSNPMIKLHTHCYKAPYLCAPYQAKTYESYGKYQCVTEKLPLVLEPYGCTNLRITYFPKADLKK